MGWTANFPLVSLALVFLCYVDLGSAYLKLAPCKDALGMLVLLDENLSFVSGRRLPLDEVQSEELLRDFSDRTALTDGVGNITLFVADNSGVLRTAADVSTNYTALLMLLSGEQGNAVSLYNQLPQAAFTVDELVEEEVVQTALGMALGMDYSLRFERSNDGSVVIKNNGPDARILYSMWGCDGIIHVTDALLWPGGPDGRLPSTNLTIYDLEPDQLATVQPNGTIPATSADVDDVDMMAAPMAPSPEGLPTGAVAAIAVGAAALAMLLAAALAVGLLCLRARRRRKAKDARLANKGSPAPGVPSSAPPLLCSISCDKSSDYKGPGSVESLRSMPSQSWEMSPSELEMCQGPQGEPVLLGSGGYGQVFRGLRNGVQPVAIKITLGHACSEEKVRRQLFREISLLRQLRDNHIVQFYGACLQGDRLMLVTEFMAGGDLFRALAGSRKPEFLWPARGQRVALDIARGLCYLHARSVAHLDLKSPNILLAADGTAKIGDMGLSRVLSKGILSQVTDVGTFSWAAPELILNEAITPAADVYSFGIVMWEIITGRVPQRGYVAQTKLEGLCPPAIEALVTRCLSVLPQKRPTAKECFDAIQGSISPSGEGPLTTTADISRLTSGAHTAAAPAAGHAGHSAFLGPSNAGCAGQGQGWGEGAAARGVAGGPTNAGSSKSGVASKSGVSAASRSWAGTGLPTAAAAAAATATTAARTSGDSARSRVPQ